MAKIASIKVEKGSLDDLTTGTIAVLDTGDGKVPNVGGTVTVKDSRGKDVDLRVVAVLAPDPGHRADRQHHRPPTPSTRSSATSRPPWPSSTSPPAPRAARRTRSRTSPTCAPTSRAQEGNAVGKLIRSVFDFLIKAVTGLLLMSVVIALIGIINTMSLSILERRRELGPAPHHRHDRQAGTPDGHPRVGADLAARHPRRHAHRPGRLAPAGAVLQPAQRRHHHARASPGSSWS